LFLGRVRNRRGEYETLETSQVNSRDNSLSEAEQRLVIIEKIARYREEKMRKEYEKLQDEL